MERWPERAPDRPAERPAARSAPAPPTGFHKAVLEEEQERIRIGLEAEAAKKAARAHRSADGRARRERWKQRGTRPAAPDSRRADRREPAREAPRTRRDRERDPNERRISFEERKRGALEDLAVYRTVSFRDLSDARFGGNDFAARRAVSQLQAEKLVVRGQGWGPKGRPFLVLAATPSGSRAAARRGEPGQRRWSGLVKPAESHHDTAVYRAARERIAELEAEGFRIRRVRIDAELKSELARAAETARASGGSRAAKEAQHAKARELGLPVEGGKVHVPDVQLEYEPHEDPERDPEREPGRANIEVVTASYKEGSIRAKAALGFQLAASGPAAAGRLASALGNGRGGNRSGAAGGGRIDLGETEGRGGTGRQSEEFEF